MFRRLIYSILIVAFVWVIFSRSAEISLLAETLTTGNWDWVFAATGLEILYLFFFAFAYQAAFFTVEIKACFGEIFPVMLGSMFVNAVAPGGGVAGVALFVDDQSRRGHSGAGNRWNGRAHDCRFQLPDADIDIEYDLFVHMGFIAFLCCHRLTGFVPHHRRAVSNFDHRMESTGIS